MEEERKERKNTFVPSSLFFLFLTAPIEPGAKMGETEERAQRQIAREYSGTIHRLTFCHAFNKYILIYLPYICTYTIRSIGAKI